MTPAEIIARAVGRKTIGTEIEYRGRWKDAGEEAVRALEEAGYAVVPLEPTEDMCMAAHRRTAAWLNLPGHPSGLSQALTKHKLRYEAMVKVAKGSINATS